MRNSAAQWRLVKALHVCLVLSLGLIGQGQAQAESSQSTPSYLGAASCASSACHGSTQGSTGSGIGLNEYLTWQRLDRHSRAYLTLLTPASQAIATALGGPAAHEDPQCLACHASAGREAGKGPRFQISDGVDCETCHGPSSPWIKTHTAGLRSAAQRQEQGLHPTWEISARAQLCVSCHVGDREHPISHAVMAAGHPPLNFELDTYLAVMPPHHRPEKADTLGKPLVSPLQHWRIGQGAAAQALLQRLDELTAKPAVLPDFGLFDCFACHHDLQLTRWSRDRAPGLRIGELRLADSALMSLQLWLDAGSSRWAQPWSDARAKLNASLTRGSAQSLDVQRQRLLELLEQIPWHETVEGGETKQILRLIQVAGTRYRTDFALAQQAAMLAGVLTQHASGNAAHTQSELRVALEALRESVSDSLSFDPERYAHTNYRFRMLAQAIFTN